MNFCLGISVHNRLYPSVGGGGGCRPAVPLKSKLKKKNILYTRLYEILLRDLLFSLNQPLKSADDQYIII